MPTPETSRMKTASDQKCRLRRGGCGGGGDVWLVGMRGAATAGPVGDLRKRFSSWLFSVDNRSSLPRGKGRVTPLYEFMAEDMATMRLSEKTAASRPA